MALNNNAININAGFEVGSQQPLDSRQWLSTAEMKNVDVNIMPDPYYAINKEDHFLYIFSKTNSISESTGYFTKYTSDGGMTVWKGSEAERDALPEETKADESIIFYTWDTDSAEYKNVVSKTVGTVENMSEADYQALETKDARTIYTTPGHIRVGEESIVNDESSRTYNFNLNHDIDPAAGKWGFCLNEILDSVQIRPHIINCDTYTMQKYKTTGITVGDPVTANAGDFITVTNVSADDVFIFTPGTGGVHNGYMSGVISGFRPALWYYDEETAGDPELKDYEDYGQYCCDIIVQGRVKIDDYSVSSNTVWSSQKSSDELDALENKFINTNAGIAYEYNGVRPCAPSTAYWGFKYGNFRHISVRPKFESGGTSYTVYRLDNSVLTWQRTFNVGDWFDLYDITDNTMIFIQSADAIPTYGDWPAGSICPRLYYMESWGATPQEFTNNNYGCDIIEYGATNRLPLEGLLVTAIGDSITEKNFRADTNWVDYMQQASRCIMSNLGISGTGFWGWDFNQRYKLRISSISGSSAILGVALSFNDLGAIGNGVAMGTVNDTTEDTWAGCVNVFYNTLFQTYPNLPVISYIQNPWENYYKGATVSDTFVDLYRQLCIKNHVPFYAEMYDNNSVLRPWIQANRERYFQSSSGVVDNVHPNSEGHKIIYNHLVDHFETNLNIIK